MRWHARILFLAIPALCGCEGFMPPTDQLPFAVSQFEASVQSPTTPTESWTIEKSADLYCADDFALSEAAEYPADKGNFHVVNVQCKPYQPSL
jgi:hypothetical protein